MKCFWSSSSTDYLFYPFLYHGGCWRKAFESLEVREGRMFRTSVDVGDKTRGECRWRLFRVSGGETRRDRAVVMVMVAVVGAEGDDAPLRWWVRDVSSFQRRGTLTSGLTNPGERISPMTDPAFCRWYRRHSVYFSRVSCLLIRCVQYNQDATNSHEKLSTETVHSRFIDW